MCVYSATFQIVSLAIVQQFVPNVSTNYQAMDSQRLEHASQHVVMVVMFVLSVHPRAKHALLDLP